MPIIYSPEIPQWGPGASRFRTDCLPACVAILLALYGKLNGLTVDALAEETGLRYSDSGLMPDAGVKLGAAHGLSLRLRGGTTLADIEAEIVAGRPVIALVAYRFISGRLDQGDNNPATDGHYFVVTGFDLDHVVVNDPDYWPPYVERGHEVLVPIRDLDLALAGDGFGSQCLFVENVPMLDELMSHLKQAEAIVTQLQIQPPTPPATEPVVAVTVKADSTNVRSGPTTAASAIVPNGLPAGTALNVQDVKVSANGHSWYRIADGPYSGGYIAQDVTSPKA